MASVEAIARGGWDAARVQAALGGRSILNGAQPSTCSSFTTRRSAVRPGGAESPGAGTGSKAWQAKPQQVGAQPLPPDAWCMQPSSSGLAATDALASP